MAPRSLIKEFCEKATCSVCLGYFKEPVTIDCGHNFCQACLTHCWRESDRGPSCPQCREVFQQKNFRPNRQLANLVELVKELETRKGVDGEREGCKKPQEPLKLFCDDNEAVTMTKLWEERKTDGVRGVSWKRDEILDLLEIWGERRVQVALRESHKNKDIFEDVAKSMFERGHTRTGIECRTKTKRLRRAYGRVLLGDSEVTCPYFKELDRILKGDPTVKPKRLSPSLHRENGSRREALPQEVIIDLSPLNTEERDEDQEETASTSKTHDSVGDVQSHMEDSVLENPDETVIDLDEEEDIVEASQQKEEIPARLEKNPEEIPTGVAQCDLSPSSRLTVMRAKRKRVSAVQRVGEEMMRQSSHEHRVMIEANREQHREFMMEMRAVREEERKSNQAMYSLFREALSTLSEMSTAILQSRAGVTQQRVQRHVEEHHFESFPSTLKVDELPWGETQGESSQVVTSPTETTTTTMERRTRTLDAKREGKAQRPTLAAVRSRRAVKARKPYSPSK